MYTRVIRRDGRSESLAATGASKQTGRQAGAVHPPLYSATSAGPSPRAWIGKYISVKPPLGGGASSDLNPAAGMLLNARFG